NFSGSCTEAATAPRLCYLAQWLTKTKLNEGKIYVVCAGPDPDVAPCWEARTSPSKCHSFNLRRSAGSHSNHGLYPSPRKARKIQSALYALGHAADRLLNLFLLGITGLAPFRDCCALS